MGPDTFPIRVGFCKVLDTGKDPFGFPPLLFLSAQLQVRTQGIGGVKKAPTLLLG